LECVFGFITNLEKGFKEVVYMDARKLNLRKLVFFMKEKKFNLE